MHADNLCVVTPPTVAFVASVDNKRNTYNYTYEYTYRLSLSLTAITTTLTAWPVTFYRLWAHQ